MKKMRAYFNIGKLRANMYLKRAAVNNYPVKAYIEPTLFCNLRCPACPTGLQLGLRPSATMDVNLFKKAIDEIGDYVFELMMYNWGEPLLHKQTPEMIRYAKDKKIERIRLSTNLSFNLSDDYIERLVRSGLDHLIVSLDGMSQETYSKYRRRGDFDLVSQNMWRIHEAKERIGSPTPHIIWQFLVFQHNEHEIERVMAEYQSWGADQLTLFGAEMPYEAEAEGFAPSTIPAYNQYHPDHPLHKDLKNYTASGKPCSWLYGVFLLNPNGKVSPCCSVPDEQDDFAEYRSSGSFFDAWNSLDFQRARRLFTRSSQAASQNVTGKPPTPRTEQAGSEPQARDSKKKRIILPILGNGQKKTTAEEDQLICQSCPIPYRQHEALTVIDETAATLLQTYNRESSLWRKWRPLAAYLLMGAPDARQYLPAYLSLEAPNLRVFIRTLGHLTLNSLPLKRGDSKLS